MLWTEIRTSYCVLGYGADQLRILSNYGLQSERIARIGFQYDPSELLSVVTRDNGYFALTGQALVQKGWHLLASILSRVQSKAKFVVSFRDQEYAAYAISKYGLDQYLNNGRIKIVTG